MSFEVGKNNTVNNSYSTNAIAHPRPMPIHPNFPTIMSLDHSSFPQMSSGDYQPMDFSILNNPTKPEHIHQRPEFDAIQYGYQINTGNNDVYAKAVLKFAEYQEQMKDTKVFAFLGSEKNSASNNNYSLKGEITTIDANGNDRTYTADEFANLLIEENKANIDGENVVMMFPMRYSDAMSRNLAESLGKAMEEGRISPKQITLYGFQGDFDRFLSMANPVTTPTDDKYQYGLPFKGNASISTVIMQGHHYNVSHSTQRFGN